MSKPNATMAGTIHTVADPEYDGTYLGAALQKTEFWLLIEFASAEELRQAFKAGECAFTVFGEKGKEGST